MNETIQNILDRRSIRSYLPIPVEKEKIKAVVECGQYAPTAMGRQPWHFTVITNRQVLDKITAENKQIMLHSPNEGTRFRAQDPSYDSFRGAPVAVIISGEKSSNFAAADCANAMENMAIAAQSLGLGSCYLASFKIALEAPEGNYLLKELKIPSDFTPLYALALGYSNEAPPERAARKENAVTWIY